MNIFKKLYARTFQLCFKIVLPILPYRNPIILNKIEDISLALSKEKKQKPLIVTDKTIVNLGLTNNLEKVLTDGSYSYVLYDNVVANPTTDNVLEALKIYKDEGCDSIIAFGGGSPMDCAKGVGALIAKPKKTLNDLKGILKIRKKIPLLIAIPTTAGTGSETTLACVIVDSKTRHKYAINDFPLIPRYAVLDEEVTMTLPFHIVASTGLDALTHAIESFIGRSGNKETKKDALEAIKLIFENLEESCFQKTISSRKNMLLASHKAGRSFSKAYVGYVHAIAHSLGGKYDIPHGLANAVILPVVLKEYGKKIDKKMFKIARYCGFIEKNASYASAKDLMIEKIEKLNEKLNIPKSFSNIKEEDINELAKYAYKEANPLYPVPVLWNMKHLKNIYYIIGTENEKRRNN